MQLLSLIVLAQAAAALPPADIEIKARVTARELRIHKQGRAALTVRGNGENLLKIDAPSANGRKRIANPRINVDVQVRIAGTDAPRPPE